MDVFFLANTSVFSVTAAYQADTTSKVDNKNKCIGEHTYGLQRAGGDTMKQVVL